MTLRPKKNCEICGFSKKAVLHRHHIIPRTDPISTNKDNNLAILCPNCHSCVHTGEFVIIGIYQTSTGKELMWFKKDEKPPIPKEFWIVKDNPLVIRSKNGRKDEIK